VGVVFLVAAASKLLAPKQFSQRIGDFGLIFDALVEPAAWAIMAAELVVGIALVFRRRGSLAGTSAILLLFLGVLTYGTALGLDIDCGCFGPSVDISLRTQLLVDFGLLLLCAIIYFTNERRDDRRLVGEFPEVPTQNETP
jgi:putative oxidoreductase